MAKSHLLKKRRSLYDGRRQQVTVNKVTVTDGRASGPYDQERAEKAVRELLLALGEDPDREGLKETPARVARAMEILGPEIPDHLKQAGELRINHGQASLEELGSLATPPMTKDAIAGRIRRLLAMADKRAHDLGIPDTEAGLSPDLLAE